MKTKSLIILYFLLNLFTSAYSGENFKFRTMSPPGGFTYNGISSILQDRSGFIWILMDEEIYRFDGYTYKRYSAYFKEIDPYKEWNFVHFAINDAGRLYINTNNGIFYYDNITDKFSLFKDKVADAIIIGADDQLWTKNNNIWSITNTKTKQGDYLLFDGKQLPNISSIYCKYNDDFYMFSYDGKIYRYDSSRKGFSLCTVLPDRNKRILSAKAYKGKLWVLVEKGTLYKLDLSTFTIEEKMEILDNEASLTRRAFYLDKNGLIWVGTINGIYIINPRTKTSTHFQHNESDPFSLPNNSIWTINEDRQKNIWIGTYSGSLCYVNLDEKQPFETFLPHENSLNHAPVSAFAEDKNYIWVGTEGGGINQINKSTGIFTYYNQESQSNHVSSNNIKSLVIDKSNNLWIGTFTGGIDCFNLSSGKKQNFKKTGNINSLRNNDIRKIVLESDSGLWIAYQQKKLEISFYSFGTKSFTHYIFPNGYKNEYIFDIIKGRGDQLWILTKETIFMFDVKSKKIKDLKLSKQKFFNFNTFCADESGNLWIGTFGNGLIKLDPNTNKIDIFDDFSQHNVSSIFNICYDTEGYLWIGTDDGLFSFNIKSKKLARFSKHDGVQGQVYYPLATMRGTDGKLYFGGTNGFTIINPKEVSQNLYKPKVIISDFYIDYKLTKLMIRTKKETQQIKLKYNQNNFGIRFSSDNFLIPEKTYFKYRLKGYDDRWIEVNADNRTAFYSKMPSGVYYFEVMASNNDGVWSQEPTVLKVICKPAPWFSWPAYLLYLIIILYTVYYIYKYLQDKKDLELQLYLENVEKEKKEEIHQSQLRFFTNISHDFRTPLSLIIATLERLRQEGLKEYYYKILNNNAHRLLNLVNELMDFRTIENGKMKLELRSTNLNKFLTELGADFIDYAKQKNISFNIICDHNLANELYIDRNIVEKIVLNLLNNAFKNTKEGGSITLETHSGTFTSNFDNKFIIKEREVTDDAFIISIRDTGVGIPKENMPNVFDRFYKVSSNNLETHLSTGIGLALVKSLVLLHRGTIGVFSEIDKGTDFIVALSKNRDIYEPSHFIAENEAIEINPIINPNDKKNIHTEQLIPAKNKKKILLVEDNDELRTIIADYLSSDFEILPAGDGEVATKILSNKVVDIIISDIMMPKKDGITFSREVKNNVETSHIPIILLTAKTSIESKLEGADSGADIYFEKPVSLELLKTTIHNIFKQQHQLKEYYARNHFADSAELSSNDRDTVFLHDFIKIIEKNLDQPEMDVNYLASEMSMSRSKLYRKIKSMTDMSIIEFILSYKLKKAARLLIEKDMSMREIMDVIGIESQPYFTNAFKKEYGETPSAFASKYKK